ncbi:MAG TPA: PEP-CTERM sorting domain-containing protein [Kiritimatiellia bacterium]|nr:PEP-CTERM sorting domain-containing protein [Kiritimatiellia bacterium]HMP35479.1 PEP-CTERM sorting domain-containing protein [Kiritimatiellia bacterium]
MKMTKILAALTAIGLAVGTAQAATDIFGSYVQIGSTVYGGAEWGATDVTDLNGANLGSFNIGDTLTIADAEVQTFKNGGSDVTGAEYQWRVWSGTPGGSFNVVALGFTADAPFTSLAGNTASGGGDQNWGTPASTPNILASLDAGSYSLEVFFRAFTNEGDRFSNNGGNNFVATFTVVPEPGTLALLGVGMATLGIVRRRRA